MKRSLVLASVAGLALAMAAPANAVPMCYGYPCPPPPPKIHHHFGKGPNPWPVWVIMGCATGVVVAAVAVNASQNRQLAPFEAWTCGLGALFAPVAPMPVAVRASY